MSSTSLSQLLPPGYRTIQDFLLRCHNRKAPCPAQDNHIQQEKTQNEKRYKVQPCLSCIPEATQSTKPNTNGRYYYEGSYKSSTIPSELPKPNSISFNPI